MTLDPNVRLNILQVVEDVLVKYIVSQNVPALIDEDPVKQQHVYRGIENRDTQANEGEESSIARLPCVIVSCPDADPVLTYFPGNWHPVATVDMWGNSFDMTDTQYALFVEYVLQSILVKDLMDRLKVVDPQFFFQKWVIGKLGYRISGNCWVHSIPITFREATGNAVPN